MAFIRSFVIKEAWFPVIVIFLSRACFSTVKEKVFVKAEYFSLGSPVFKEKSAFLYKQ